MRILERGTNQVFSDIELFLTMDEALELSGRLEGLISNPKAHHFHLETEGRELIISMYSEKNINEFDERSKELILKGR
ncbi:MAG: hypothetical protein ABI543_09040 [Ignavibacteria bacterium]